MSSVLHLGKFTWAFLGLCIGVQTPQCICVMGVFPIDFCVSAHRMIGLCPTR